jgi:peroxiredoxin family protein/TusA-related sulfurtransferase
VDLREEAEFLIGTIPGAINLPFNNVKNLYTIPKEKPVYVFCHTGSFSEEVVELLSDADYEVYHLEGGYNAYRNLKVEIHELDATGLKCPGPIVKVADAIKSIADGNQLHIRATEDAFASDIQIWCQRTGNILVHLETKDGIIEALVEKATIKHYEENVSQHNDKTIVVFSGDLDKTIATFIIANGAAALGRKVTIFFTFWGLNILRKPKHIRVRKTIIEKMFGFMMPRGTYKLGLSRMNMFGMGSKMIRQIMKSKHVSSLEELIADALNHGVRLVACQMSMDIMGIHKEELIDGVELGGVATFLGSGELSDMSLFI